MKTYCMALVLAACGGAWAQAAVPPPPVLTLPAVPSAPSVAPASVPVVPVVPTAGAPSAAPGTERVAPAAAAPAAPATSTTTPGSATEPRVERLVSEDNGVRIEELRVRGQTVRVVVYPKGGAAPYEIVPAGSARDMSQNASSTRGAAGQRVWQVWSF